MTYDPWDDLRSRSDLTFGVTSLPAGDAWWLPDVPGIVLDSRLSRIERRCALTHELIHAERSDTQCAGIGPDGSRLARRREREADREAARRLITLDRLADALRWALCADDVATELDVTPHLARIRVLGLTAVEKDWIEAAISGEERGIA